MADKTPYRIGKMGDEQKQLHNTYLATNSGLLIPDTFYFFSDTFRTVGGIKSFSDFREVLTTDEYNTPKFLERMIMEGKKDIDEILAVVDPDNSFGIVKTHHRGLFLPETISFFNTASLRGLFERLANPQYNFEANRLTQNYAELNRYWEDMKQQFYVYLEQLQTETGDIIPRNLDELDVKFNQQITTPP